MSEYPRIEPGKLGFIVRVNQRVTLPSSYTSENKARRALEGYLRRQAAARKPRGK